MLDRLSPRPGARRRRKRVGRGPGSGFNKTAGRGVKGQGKRSAGRETPLWFEGGQMPLVRRVPKRGFKNIHRKPVETLNLRELVGFSEGASVDPEALVAAGLIRGRAGIVKLLGDGDAPAKLSVKVHRASAAAIAKIEAAGGNVEILDLIGGVQNIGRIPELQKRILFTLGMLGVYRIGAKIAVPGINPDIIRQTFEQLQGSAFTLFNVFSGGALEQLSVFALGIMPYISASIIMQLLTVVVPQLEALKKEGAEGQKKITQYTRYGTIVLALFQGFLLATALEGGQFGAGAVLEGGLGFKLLTMLTLTAGTTFIMWLGEQITERGIGNGISLVIFSGIIVTVPSALAQLVELVRTEQFSLLQVLFLFAFIIVLTGFVVFVERGQRRIPIQHARRVVGRKVTQAGTSYFPLRVNTANVIPPIFASSLLIFPSTIAQFADSGEFVDRLFQDYLFPGGVLYNAVYVGLIIFFCFFYTAIVINPEDVADNIKRSGGSIPGIRPGKRTAEFIDHILGRITFVGAVYVSAICVVPVLLSTQLGVPFYFGGTALLIVVGVSMDLMAQIEAHLVSRQYEGFVQGARMRGRIG